jgi:hypothetical protein
VSAIDYAARAPVFVSPNGPKGLKAHYKKAWDFRAVMLITAALFPYMENLGFHNHLSNELQHLV